MRLVDTLTLGDGVVILTYDPVQGPGESEPHVPETIGAEAE
jgi:hypothetical protein